MAFDQPFYHQNTHVNITVLVVDDDPVFLSIILNMLKTPNYRDESFGEIIVMTANDSSEAVSKLRGQCNNIDVVITDYHMPGLNGVQLKKRITEEFGNLPVIVISADMSNEIEQETLSSGAMCFMRKPIKSNDLNIICKHALNYKLNDGFKEIQKTDPTSNSDDGDSRPEATKKSKIKWSGPLENHFCKAIQHIGVHKATPKKILEFMNLDYLTRAHVASKLQKYRKFLKKVKDDGEEKARRAMISNFRSSSCIKPQRSYNYNTNRSKINLFDPQPGNGFGQSSPMMKNNAEFHGSFNYMNRGPIYNLSQTGSNLLPRRGSLGFPNGMFPLKEESSRISGTSQKSQPPRFGKYGTTSDVLGMNSILTTGTTGSNYAGIRIDEIGVNGNGNGSLGGIRTHGTDSLGGIRVHGTGNGSLSGIQVHGTSNGNGSLGETLGGMNWNFNNKNTSDHGNSTSTFPSAFSSFLDNKDQSQNYLNAQTDGVVPVLENPRILNDHHGSNELFCATINSQFDQNQHQGNVNGENHEVSTAYPLEDISNWSFNNGDNNEETLNSLAANWEMYFPTDQDINITNQEPVLDLTEFPVLFDQDFDDENFMKYLFDHDMN